MSILQFVNGVLWWNEITVGRNQIDMTFYKIGELVCRVEGKQPNWEG